MIFLSFSFFRKLVRKEKKTENENQILLKKNFLLLHVGVLATHADKGEQIRYVPNSYPNSNSIW